jgi:hypothetical protein
MEFFKTLGNLDRRWYFLALAILIAAPLIRPLALPTSISEYTRQTYRELSKIKPGDKILMGVAYGGSSAAECHPGALVVFKMVMQKNARIVFVSFNAEAPMFVEEILKAKEATGKQYGVDFVNVGFIAGQETAIAGFAAKPRTFIQNDFRGNRLDSLPLMKEINDARDFTFSCITSAGTPGYGEWNRQICTPYKVPAMTVTTANGMPSMVPFLHSGQLAGLVGGMRGGAELEKISNNPGPALTGMDAQSLGHLFIVLMIVLSNIGFALERLSSRKAKPPAKP